MISPRGFAGAGRLGGWRPAGLPSRPIEIAMLLPDERPKARTARTCTSLIVAKAQPAARGSTGEQKALLLGLVLAHAELVRQGAALRRSCCSTRLPPTSTPIAAPRCSPGWRVAARCG